ncbi:hypothetical protein TSAR_015097 [Trichomalopsis sarcophagae]|uniref:Reverse transcriptase domain-containing protein n=1 Tax=Trichomalopsis sarcophagae TaxID=543379 RepID=A0A232EJ80_9HYME|nr:hypothetical protein TSAR_015097 [Trichomalopsis sarcophagae]
MKLESPVFSKTTWEPPMRFLSKFQREYRIIVLNSLSTKHLDSRPQASENPYKMKSEESKILANIFDNATRTTIYNCLLGAILNTGITKGRCNQQKANTCSNYIIKLPFWLILRVNQTRTQGTIDVETLLHSSIIIKKQMRASVLIGDFHVDINFMIIPELIRPCILGIDFQEQYNCGVNVGEVFLKLDPARNDLVKIPFLIQKASISDRIAHAKFCANLCQGSDNYADLTDNSETDFTNTEINQKLEPVTGLNQDEQGDLSISLKSSHMFSKKNQEDFYLLDDTPFFKKSRLVEIQLIKALRDEIHRVECLSIIERSDIIYINSIVPVYKKDNSVRVCLAALDLNELIQSDYDGPDKIDQVFKRTREFSIMSSIDSTASYWQVALAEKSWKYTGFLLKMIGCLYRLIIAPIWVIQGRFFEDAQMKEMRFLGYILPPEGIKPNEEKVQGIYNYPVPQNVKQLKGFHGILNFSSKFTSSLLKLLSIIWALERFRTYLLKSQNVAVDALSRICPKERSKISLDTFVGAVELGDDLRQQLNN